MTDNKITKFEGLDGPDVIVVDRIVTYQARVRKNTGTAEKPSFTWVYEIHTARIEATIDLGMLVARIGGRAAKSKAGRSRFMDGIIKAKRVK